MHKEDEWNNFLGGWIFVLGRINVLEIFRNFFGWEFEKNILIFLEQIPKLLKPQIWKNTLMWRFAKYFKKNKMFSFQLSLIIFIHYIKIENFQGFQSCIEDQIYF